MLTANYSPFVAAFAPGEDIWCPGDSFTDSADYVRNSGTSFYKTSETKTPCFRLFLSSRDDSLVLIRFRHISSFPSSCRAGWLLQSCAISMAGSVGRSKQRPEAYSIVCT